jgi:hypothetical protein
MKTEKNPRGAGRKPVPIKKKTFSVACYPHQIAEIRKFVKSLNDDTNIFNSNDSRNVTISSDITTA